MYYYTTPSVDTSFAEKKPSWKPWDVLEIINQDTECNSITCIYDLPSKGRRCRMAIRADNRNRIVAMLSEIAYLPPNSPAVASKLRDIASLALCLRYHQGEKDSILQKWQRKIQAAEPRFRSQPGDNAGEFKKLMVGLEEQSKRHRAEKRRLRETQKFEEEEREYRRQQQRREEQQQEKKRQERERRQKAQEKEERERRQEAQEKKERERRQKAQKKEERERRQETQEKEERERRQKAQEKEEQRRQQEAQENEERERRQKAQEKEEQRRQQEAQENEEQKRRQKDREKTDHEERLRQKAEKQRKEREERERREKERLKMERDEWDNTWMNYQKRWAAFKGTFSTATTRTRANLYPQSAMGNAGTKGDNQDAIPWPVKSGQHIAVTKAAINEFFRNAPPRSASAAELVKLTRLECLKWHPDKCAALFRGRELSDADKAVLNLICHVLIEIRDEASKKRRD
jgi:hypothetical protein